MFDVDGGGRCARSGLRSPAMRARSARPSTSEDLRGAARRLHAPLHRARETSWPRPTNPSWRGRDGASPVVPVFGVYQEGGFDVADDFLDLPDHVAAELEFLYLTIFRAAQATPGRRRRRAGEVGSARASLPRAASRRVGDAVRRRRSARGAASAFYRALADATERFVVAERERLGSSVPSQRFVEEWMDSKEPAARKGDENGALGEAARSGYREYPRGPRQCSASFLARLCTTNF